MKLPVKTIKYLPLWFITIALLLFVLLVKLGPRFNPVPVPELIPAVKVMPAKFENAYVPVYSQGIINPRTDIELSADVAGRIIEVPPVLANGLFFKKDDILLKIDPSNYLAEIERAKSAVATAQLSYKQAKSRGANALIEEARARLNAATATLKQARAQYEKTSVKAPFDGRVRDRHVGVGQYASPGLPIARIYATDMSEIRLPLSDEQLGLVTIPTYEESITTDGPSKGSKVTLNARMGGKTYTWTGNLARSEGAVNEATRLLYVVAQIPDPYAKDPKQPDRPILPAGLYVQARIDGRLLKNVIVLPRRLLRNENKVLVVDKESRLALKTVVVKYRGRDHVYIESGLMPGDQVVTTPVELVVEGIKVKLEGVPPVKADDAGEKKSVDKKASETKASETKPAATGKITPAVSSDASKKNKAGAR